MIMRLPWLSSLLLVGAILAIFRQGSVLALTQTVCSAQGNETCAVNGTSRVCIDTDGVEGCGYCLPGYIEFQEECYDIEEINYTAIVDFFRPQFTVERTDEQREAILKLICVFISNFMSQIPPPSYEFALNKFSMDTPEEAVQRTGFVYSDDADAPTFEAWDVSTDNLRKLQRVPSAVDWRGTGALTYVKNQQRCGCCWAVAMAGALEGSVFVTTGFSQSLSFQQMISCNDANGGCNGGDLRFAMLYAVGNEFGGMASANDYPFSDDDGETTEECKLEGKNVTAMFEDPRIVVNYGDDYTFEERMLRLKQAVAYVPLAVTIKSNCRTFSNYRKGVITDDDDCACDNIGCIDHAIMLVGYNDDHDPPYWILRNSWDEDWGEDGYFRISQAESGSWGLFGVLGFGIGAVQGFNTTQQEADIEPDDELETWAVIGIIVAGVAVLVCCAVAIMKCGKKNEE